MRGGDLTNRVNPGIAVDVAMLFSAKCREQLRPGIIARIMSRFKKPTHHTVGIDMGNPLIAAMNKVPVPRLTRLQDDYRIFVIYPNDLSDEEVLEVNDLFKLFGLYAEALFIDSLDSLRENIDTLLIHYVISNFAQDRGATVKYVYPFVSWEDGLDTLTRLID